MKKLFERIRKLVDFFEKSNQTAFAKKIGADGYSANAVEAVKLVDRLLAG